jgi:ribosome-associated protein
LNAGDEPSSLQSVVPPEGTTRNSCRAFPEPRTRPLKAPAKKTAGQEGRAEKSAPKKNASTPAKKAAARAAKPIAQAKGRPATKKAAPPARAARPARPAAPAEPLPEIPAELLEAAPKSKKPRKPRGRKAEAAKPSGALDVILAQLDDAKAQQVVTIPLDDKTAVADAMVVASGGSTRHVGAIADQLVQKLKEKGYRDLRIEGMPQCDWVLVDAGDVVVHIFRPEVRGFYNLEKLSFRPRTGRPRGRVSA